MLCSVIFIILEFVDFCLFESLVNATYKFSVISREASATGYDSLSTSLQHGMKESEFWSIVVSGAHAVFSLHTHRDRQTHMHARTVAIIIIIIIIIITIIIIIIDDF
jgi:hypothetical protein